VASPEHHNLASALRVWLFKRAIRENDSH